MVDVPVFSVAVGVMVWKGPQILLGQRKGTGYADGFYALVGGRVEPQETLLQAAVRELAEETGLTCSPQALELSTLLHVRKTENISLLLVCFSLRDWEGSPQNREPHKCDHLSFFDARALPNTLNPATRQAITQHLNQVPYGQYGWDGPPEAQLLQQTPST